MKHLIFDTETTNLIHNSLQPLHKQPRIIEIFGLILDDCDWSEVGKFHSYIDPGVPISAEVTKITKITSDMVTGKPKFSAIAPQWQEFIGPADVVVAHNISYDLAVTGFEFQRLGTQCSWPARHVCTVESTEHIKGHRLSLTKLHEHLFGEAFTNAHSAEDDVRATARCYVELHRLGEL